MASASSASNHSHNPISYVAPFAASVLRDEIMTNLNNEHDVLKEELIRQQQDEQLRVEITGQGGDTLHCETSIAYGVTGKMLVDDTPLWKVFF